MGRYPMADPEKCPKCGRDLREHPKPERVTVPDFPAEATYGTDPVCR
jgi:rRNA maturation protein Nop10